MLALRLNSWIRQSKYLPEYFKASDIWYAHTIVYGQLEINWNE